MRKSVLLLASVALVVLLASGVALAASITCEPSTSKNPCRGTPEEDTLRGTVENDYILGLGGADTLIGKRRPDYLEGGGANDTLRGEGGRDGLFGDDEDRLSEARGNDRLIGGPQDDSLNGGPGIDRMIGGAGDDDIGAYVFVSANFNRNFDYAYGNDGRDFIWGYAGEFYGGDGEDSLSSSSGDAILDGGAGNDHIHPAACEENTTQEAIGGPGEDDFWPDPNLCGVGSPSPGTVIIRAVDGEQDLISCFEAVHEIVRADAQDTFHEYAPAKIGREHCDSLTIVE